MTDAWLAALARRERREPVVVGREPLSGGYTSPAVDRVDLDDGRSVIVKAPTPVEVAALRAIAVVDGVERPRLLAAAGDRIVLSCDDGAVAPLDRPAPDGVWRTLALVHAHWRRNRPRGVPVVDAAWWRRRCEHEAGAVREAARREPDLAAVAEAVAAWADDARIGRALAVLPRTLCHGDANRANVLVSDAASTLIDWGSALVAPGGLDVAVLSAPDPSGPADAPPHPVPEAYTATLAQRLGAVDPPELTAVEREWALVAAHVGYLGFAADHQGVDRVRSMAEVAAAALTRLGVALNALDR